MIDVLFVVLPDTLLLDLAGPAETFRLANQALGRRGQGPLFRLLYVGPQAQVNSSVGLGLSPIAPLPSHLRAPSWVFLLGRPGDATQVVRRQAAWLRTRDWLARMLGPSLESTSSGVAEQSGHRLFTVCVGALLAADAGLVGQRAVTTHHELIDDLRTMLPQARVVENRVFVEDGPLASSAGVTAGIDLALHAVAQVCDDALAQTVARVLVTFSRRGPMDPERSPLLAFRDHLHPAVHRVQDAVCAAPAQPWDVDTLAAVAHVTPRHLGRLFLQTLGLAPRAYVERVRLALARQALGRGATAAQSARLAGFRSERQLRDALRRDLPAPGQSSSPNS